MHLPSVTGTEASVRARHGSAADLRTALQASRRDTLQLFAALREALPGLQVPRHPELNPPLWEVGHVGWFQSRWLERNPQWADGVQADPEAPRLPPRLDNADALYDSSAVPHAQRWDLPLPAAERLIAELDLGLERTLALLERLERERLGGDDRALYFFRLALLHEDMHHEAGLYMAQALGVALRDPRWQPQPLGPAPAAMTVAAQTWPAGAAAEGGFAFDNELGAHEHALPAFNIDAQVLRWAEYLPFVEAGGYGQPRWWTEAGWAWRHAAPDACFAPPIGGERPPEAGGPVTAPRYLHRDGGRWWEWRRGQWRALDLELPACHLSAHEAQAWCTWAGRRLPTEFEWECAAHQPRFRWGQVWEWTASAFGPYPGFQAHPYRDYSAPWFDGRPVLRGGSFMTQPRMRHRRYRNYFAAHRRDVPSGFRTCSISGP